jgi:hypothetical protein
MLVVNNLPKISAAPKEGYKRAKTPQQAVSNHQKGQKI